MPATLLKVTLIHGSFSRFLNCKNGTKSRKASHIYTRISILNQILHFKAFTLLISRVHNSQISENEHTLLKSNSLFQNLTRSLTVGVLDTCLKWMD